MASTQDTNGIMISKVDLDRFWDEVLGDKWYSEEDNLSDAFWESENATELLTYMPLTYAGPGTPESTAWISNHDIETKHFDGLELLRRWLAGQTQATLTITVPTDAEAKLRAFVAELNGQVH